MLYIVIPYRSREDNLRQFLCECLPLLKEHLGDFKVVVVEQGNTKPFNRGLLLNVGVKEFVKKADDTVILQDVDTLPLEPTVANCYAGAARDAEAVGIYTVPYTLGGVTKLTQSSFERMNGFPTNYWGWGWEDLALRERADMAGVRCKVVCSPDSRHRDWMFRIAPAPESKPLPGPFPGGSHQNALLHHYFDAADHEKKIDIIRRSGLSTTHYRVLRHVVLDKEPQVELLTVDI